MVLSRRAVMDVKKVRIAGFFGRKFPHSALANRLSVNILRALSLCIAPHLVTACALNPSDKP